MKSLFFPQINQEKNCAKLNIFLGLDIVRKVKYRLLLLLWSDISNIQVIKYCLRKKHVNLKCLLWSTEQNLRFDFTHISKFPHHLAPRASTRPWPAQASIKRKQTALALGEMEGKSSQAIASSPGFMIRFLNREGKTMLSSSLPDPLEFQK